MGAGRTHTHTHKGFQPLEYAYTLVLCFDMLIECVVLCCVVWPGLVLSCGRLVIVLCYVVIYCLVVVFCSVVLSCVVLWLYCGNMGLYCYLALLCLFMSCLMVVVLRNTHTHLCCVLIWS